MTYKTLAISLFCLALTACQDTITDTSYKAANTVEDNASLTWNKARNVLDLKRNPPPIPPTPKTQPRYCYNFWEDIVCYAQPIEGEESRLVSWQGSAGQTGYVLPTEKPKKEETDDDKKLTPLKPVDVGAPPPITESKKLKEIFFDPAELDPKELVPQKTE
jgi:hypothetical protein